MENLFIQYEATMRLAAFLGMFALIAGAEIIRPRRADVDRRHRWPLNLGMVMLGSLSLRALGPLIAVSAAIWAHKHDIGLFHALDWPHGIEIFLMVVLLDLAIYAQHVAFHKIPFLWRLHRMHHADLSLDVTSGLRFHPLEYLLSMLIKSAVVVALGADLLAVILFEILLNATAMFNHGNLRLPRRLDRFLRRLIVTPDFHLVHHSVTRDEHDRNYGFNLPWWDYAFKTYKAAPDLGVDGMIIGLKPWRRQKELGFWPLMMMPFLSDNLDDGKKPDEGMRTDS